MGHAYSCVLHRRIFKSGGIYKCNQSVRQKYAYGISGAHGADQRTEKGTRGAEGRTDCITAGKTERAGKSQQPDRGYAEEDTGIQREN